MGQIHYFELHVTVPVGNGPFWVEQLKQIAPQGWKVPTLQTRQGVIVVDILTARAPTYDEALAKLAECERFLQCAVLIEPQASESLKLTLIKDDKVVWSQVKTTKAWAEMADKFYGRDRA